MIRRPPRSTLDRSSAASDVYKRQIENSAVLLYPNPASKEINVSMKNGSALSNWSIVDALGKTVLQGLNSDFKNPLLTISTASLADGIYTVKMISDGALFQKKISIVR